jgi:hypothetical protein
VTQNKESYKPLFTSDADWRHDACINQKVIHDFDLYAEGYKTAGDILVRHVIEHSSDQDILVYPIVFLYRQHIELRLKEIIREGSRLLGDSSDFPAKHELHILWPIAKGIIKKIWPQGDSKEEAFIDHFVKEFSAIDSKSDSFRYPENRSGQNPLENLSHLGIKHFAEMAERVSIFLYGVSAAITDYSEAY